MSSFCTNSQEGYLEPSQTSKIKLFAEMVRNFQLLTIFEKISILDLRLRSEYACIQLIFTVN